VLAAHLPPWFWLTSAFAFGLALGSFLNVVIYRLPREMSLAHPPSTCPHCGTRIRIYDNVPVFGWLLLRGKARCCGGKISARYPLIELLGGLFAVAVVTARILPNPELPLVQAVLLFGLYLALCLGLLAAAAIDLEYMILPDAITLGGTALGVVSCLVRSEVDLSGSLLGAVGGFLVIWFPFVWLHEKLRGFPGMGLGDAKLVALSGAWFGLPGALFCLFAGAIQGTLATGVVTLLGVKLEEPAAVVKEREELHRLLETAEGEERAELLEILKEDPVMKESDGTLMSARIPFGPFLALATFELCLLYEPLLAQARSWLLL
jgi:leader peptidase (prepilin peptidase)/N-methyltransferase